jgi:hypothetical protein
MIIFDSAPMYYLFEHLLLVAVDVVPIEGKLDWREELLYFRCLEELY